MRDVLVCVFLPLASSFRLRLRANGRLLHLRGQLPIPDVRKSEDTIGRMQQQEYSWRWDLRIEGTEMMKADG